MCSWCLISSSCIECQLPQVPLHAVPQLLLVTTSQLQRQESQDQWTTVALHLKGCRLLVSSFWALYALLGMGARHHQPDSVLHIILPSIA